MPIEPDAVLALTENGSAEFTERDSILYALGVGFGRDPLDAASLPYVYEGAGLRAVPTMATLFGMGTGILLESGVDYTKLVHAEQRLAIHRPFPASGTVAFRTRVVDCLDKGAERGALLLFQAELFLAETHQPICTLGASLLARGDGGFGGPAKGGPPPHHLPDRSPDHARHLAIRPEQAALYRLSGDLNPLHIDPAAARRVGFERPILHGLCSYGTLCRAVIQDFCAGDADRIRAFDVRFSNPIYPGETLLAEFWREGDILSFRATAEERGAVVLNNGRCVLAPERPSRRR